MKEQNTGWGLGILGTALGLAVAGTLLYYRKRPTAPQGIKVVKPFELARFLGHWYEICRMPMRFENGLSQVSAEYTLNPDGSIRVVNSGYDADCGRWYKAVGRGVFVGNSDEARLKVSFLGPLYAGYNVVSVDEDYRYALVFGRSLDYMWILSREPEVPEHILRKYIEKAIAAGYNHYRLVWTEQEEF